MTSQPRSTWSPLAHPLFRALWIASTVSHIGSYMTDVGQGWLWGKAMPRDAFAQMLAASTPEATSA